MESEAPQQSAQLWMNSLCSTHPALHQNAPKLPTKRFITPFYSLLPTPTRVTTRHPHALVSPRHFPGFYETTQTNRHRTARPPAPSPASSAPPGPPQSPPGRAQSRGLLADANWPPRQEKARAFNSRQGSSFQLLVDVSRAVWRIFDKDPPARPAGVV